MTHSFGWRRDSPDHRDYAFKAPRKLAIQSVKLSDKFLLPPVLDQGQLGSCTGHGIASIVYFNLLNKHAQVQVVPSQPSRLFIYYNERVIEKTVQYDAGAEIRDGIKTVAKQGVCDETLWPYDISKFKNKPTPKCYADALKFTAVTYSRINQTKGDLVNCLLSGYPFVFGFTVYESFESLKVEKTGIVPMPTKKEKTPGGHCTYGHGYDAKADRFICRNSWGTEWGNKGDFTIPAAYLTNTNLASDFWEINTIL